MARRRIGKTRRPLRKVRPRPKALPTPPKKDPPAETPFDDPEIQQHTADILQFLQSSDSQSVAVRAEVGKLLLAIRTKLPHGSYRAYLAAHLPYKPRSASRAVNLYRFREKHPALFDKISRAGLAKAHFLITRPIPEIEALVSQQHVVPSSGATKTLVSMDFAELIELVRGATPPPDKRDVLVHNYRRAGRRMVRALDALVDQYQHIDGYELADLYEELRLTLSRFAATFELGPK